jgi:hypothetical protein
MKDEGFEEIGLSLHMQHISKDYSTPLHTQAKRLPSKEVIIIPAFVFAKYVTKMSYTF